MKDISGMDLTTHTGSLKRRPLWWIHYLFAVITGILIAGGLQLSLGIPGEFNQAKAASLQGHPLRFLLYFLKTSIHSSVDHSLQCELSALMMILIILYVLSHRCQIREIIWTGIFSVFFAFCVFFGRIFMVNPFWNVYITGLHQLVKDAWFLAAYGGACFFTILALWIWLQALPDSLPAGLSGSHGFVRPCTGKKRVLIYFLIVMVCWLPVFFIFWPGNLKGDTVIQILQYFRFPTRFQGHWISDGRNVVFTNDHPFLQTFLFGLFMDLGHSLGWNELGVSFYVFLQVTGYGMAVSLFLVSLEYFHIPPVLTRVSLAIYCLFPAYVIHAILISGDSLMTMFFLYFMLMVFWIYRTGGEVLQNKLFLAGTGLIIFLFCASKNQCVYIVVLAGILMIIVFRKKWKQILMACLLPLIVFEFLYMGLFFRFMHVEKVGSQEALSLFFQQTARTVKYHEDEIPPDQKEAIEGIINYDVIPERYDPDLADPIKRTFNEKAGSPEMKRYFMTWLKMGLRYPGDYVQSFLDSVWEYYYPLNPDKKVGFYWENFTYQDLGKRMPWARKVVPESFFRERWFTQFPSTENMRSGYRGLAALLCKLPFFSWLAYPGSVMWLALTAIFLMLLKKDYHSIGIFFPVLLVFAICMLSPKNGNYRYMLPNSFILPVMIAYVAGELCRPKDPDKDGSEKDATVPSHPDEKYVRTVPDHLL